MSSKYRWSIVKFKNIHDPFLKKLREFRSIGLYQDGKIKSYGPEGENYLDKDVLDLRSMHITVEDEEKNIIGYARIALAEGGKCQEIFGKDFYNRVKGLPIKNTYESSRWTVAKPYRGTRLGLDIVTAGFSLVKKIGGDEACLVSAVGNCARQTEYIQKILGAKKIGEDVNSQEFEDSISFLCLHQENSYIKKRITKLPKIFDEF